MGPLQTKILTEMCSSNFWDLDQINLIYALFSRIQLCRDYAFFEGHFWPKLVTGALKHFNGPGSEKRLSLLNVLLSNIYFGI